MSCINSKTPAPDTTVQDASTDIAREEFENFKRNYSELGPELTHRATSDDVIRESVDKAVARVDPAYDAAAGIASRDESRYNMHLTGAQKKLQLKQRKLNRTKTRVDVKNKTRLAASDLQDQARADVIALGQGHKDSAMGDYAAAGSLENRRNQINLNNSAQHKAGIYGLLGEGAALGASALMLSSRKAKKKIKAASPKSASKEMKELDVKNYEYKDGEGQPKGERTGVIAEDSPSVATDSGDMVKAGDWVGKLTLSFQDVDKRLQLVEKQNKKILKKTKAA